jgi:uncharacterized membrane protein
LKIKVFNWILMVIILSVLLLLTIIFVPSSVIRIILGLPFILFFPGYTLMAVLFPQRAGILPDGQENKDIINLDGPGISQPKGEKREMDVVERIALSFAMSMVIVILIGLGLNYTSWGIMPTPLLLSLFIFINLMSIIALIRQYSLGYGRILIELHIKLPGWQGTAPNKTLSLVLAVLIVVTMGLLIYAVVSPKVGEKFSDFYILGFNGKPDGYPSQFLLKDNQVISVQYSSRRLTVNSSIGKVTLGIINHEQQETSYAITITIDGQPAEIHYGNNILSKLEDIDLPHDGKWEQEIGFIPSHTGENQKVEFWLYENGHVEPKYNLHFWIDVIDK